MPQPTDALNELKNALNDYLRVSAIKFRELGEFEACWNNDAPRSGPCIVTKARMNPIYIPDEFGLKGIESRGKVYIYPFEQKDIEESIRKIKDGTRQKQQKVIDTILADINEFMGSTTDHEAVSSLSQQINARILPVLQQPLNKADLENMVNEGAIYATGDRSPKI